MLEGLVVFATLFCSIIAPLESAPYFGGGYESLTCSDTPYGGCCEVVYALEPQGDNAAKLYGVENWCFIGACRWQIEGTGWK